MNTFHLETLPNEAKLLFVPAPNRNAVVVSYTVGVGSRHEPNRVSGISHFLEHLFFKGTKKWPTAQALSSAVDSVGAGFNAWTSRDLTQYYVEADKRHIELALDVLSDMYYRALFDSTEIEREKGVIYEEMHMYQDNPMRYIEDIFEEALYKGNTLGRLVVGTEATVKRVLRQNLLEHVDRFYGTANIVLGITGDFEYPEVKKLAARFFNEKKGRTPDMGEAKEIERKSPTRPVRVSYKKTEQTHLACGFKSLPSGHDLMPELEIIAVVLGGNMSSRLFTEIRERRGLAYYVRAGIDPYRDVSSFTIHAGLRNEKVVEALGIIQEQVHSILTDGVTNDELTKAKEFIKGRTTLAFEEPDKLLDFYLAQHFRDTKIKTPEEYFKEIDAATPTGILKAAKETFITKQGTLAMIGPYRDGARFAKYLKMG